jgi:hypothetical protein
MRLDAVEIKVSLAGDQVTEGLRRFDLSGDGKRRQIFFADDPLSGAPVALPLLDGGLILRVRESADEKVESTVKLRPCRRSQLTDGWLAAGKTASSEFRLEADWTGERRVLAASCSADRKTGSLDAALEGREPLSTLFSDEQERFVEECAGLRVNLNAVVLLGPVAANRWGPLQVDRFEVVAERWRIAGALDFLELSIRVDPGQAERAQQEFEALVRGRGLDLDVRQETKTRRVLEHLAAARTN